jgi:hypothetical protein
MTAEDALHNLKFFTRNVHPDTMCRGDNVSAEERLQWTQATAELNSLKELILRGASPGQ